MSKTVFSDGVMQRVVEDQGNGRFVSQLQQANRGEILERNNELRKNPNALKHASFCGLEWSVPEADYYTIQAAIRRNNPGASERDMGHLMKKWMERYGGLYRCR